MYLGATGGQKLYCEWACSSKVVVFPRMGWTLFKEDRIPKTPSKHPD